MQCYAIPELAAHWDTVEELYDLMNSSPTGQNGRHFANDIFKWIFFNENCGISIKNLLKYVHKVPIDNNLALDQIMAWRQTGDKPLSEPMLTWFTDAYMWH